VTSCAPAAGTSARPAFTLSSKVRRRRRGEGWRTSWRRCSAASCWLRCFVLGLRQARAFQPRAVRLLQIVHTLRGDRQSRLVAARDQLLRNQVPEGELEVL